jgi:hypothetical protein
MHPWRFEPPLRSAALLGIAAAVLLLGDPASGSTATLRRSVGNIVFAPFDLVLSPVVAAGSIYGNLRDVDDSSGVRAFFVVPGFAWYTGVQALAAVVREITGLIEFVPGIALVPFETDLDPLFAPAERGDALVDVETPPLRVKFGVDYLTVSF